MLDLIMLDLRSKSTVEFEPLISMQIDENFSRHFWNVHLTMKPTKELMNREL
jgi:hypothetical protein